MTQPVNKVQLIQHSLFDELLEQARQSPRRRVNHNFHPSLDDNPHRFLNVMLRDSYFTPHRHLDPPKSESFLILQGRLAFFIFEDDGQIQDCQILGHDLPTRGIDIAPGLWHTIVVLSEHCICFEVKPGPYEQASDKEFAAWAPMEGVAECTAYQDRLREYAESASADL